MFHEKTIINQKKRYPRLSWILIVCLLLLMLLFLLLGLLKPNLFAGNHPPVPLSASLSPQVQSSDLSQLSEQMHPSSENAISEADKSPSLAPKTSADIINEKAYLLFNKFFDLRTILLRKDYNIDSELYIQSQEFLTKLDKLLLPFSSFKFDLATLDSLETEVYPKFKTILDNLNIAYDKILMKRFDKKQFNYASPEEVARFLNSGSPVSTTSNVLNKCTSLLSDLANIFKPNSDVLAISQLLSANSKI